MRWVTVGIQQSHPGQLSLAIPSWTDVMSTVNGYTATIKEETASSAQQHA